jgi:hypothetical protein
MRGRIVITARAVGVHVISALAALARDELWRSGRTWSNAVLLPLTAQITRWAGVGECATRGFSRLPEAEFPTGQSVLWRSGRTLTAIRSGVPSKP